jgi:hypothetical protein
MPRLLLAITFGALLFTPGVSSAGPVAVGDLLKFESSLGTLGGGAFLVDNTSNGAGIDFMTFCVQMTQHLDYSNLFRVGSITNSADDTPTSDPLDIRTQWIFSNFDAGLLGQYSSDEIQAAIWKIEGEWTNSFGQSEQLISLAQNSVTGWQNNGVRVLNLFYTDGRRAQDQLSLIAVAPLLPPPEGTPEPGTLAIMGIGGLVLAGRKRLKGRWSGRLA